MAHEKFTELELEVQIQEIMNRFDFEKVYNHMVGTGHQWYMGSVRGMAIPDIDDLRESPAIEVVEKLITQYPEDGNNVVVKPIYKEGNVYINETQCFEDVPEVAWNFYIGGYQPAQKWLKDRKDRELQIDDIRHYMKIIVALTETDRLMKEVDKIEIE
jgi:hypothetical protein